MKKIIVVLLMTVFVSGVHAKISDYLPQTGELRDWEPTGTPQHVVGDDLFLLINGGAEIYHEYGFKQALTQGFKHKNKPSLGFNLEIYEMKTPEAAYGVFTFKTGDSAKPIDVGSEGLLEDYYINVWKGNFLVTVIGFDSQKDTLDGIIQVARLVTGKIKESGQKPELLRILPNDNKYQLKFNGITYLKGNLALFNQYEFASKDIFGLKEGVAAKYSDFRLFIFRYKDRVESQKWFDCAQKYLKKSSFLKNFRIRESSFSFTDKKDDPFYTYIHKYYIFIIQGKKKEDLINTIKRKSVEIGRVD
jgi:hypothetical protein